MRRIYADLEGYISPSIISGEDKRPDIIIVERDTVYIFELTIGFETNISTNSESKKNNYSELLEDLKSRYKKVKFINLSMGAIGIYGDTCFNLKSVLKHLGLNENEVNYLLRKLCNICIRATYFFSVNETRHGITLPCYHGSFDTLSLQKLCGLTQSPHSPQLALSTYNCPFSGVSPYNRPRCHACFFSEWPRLDF